MTDFTLVILCSGCLFLYTLFYLNWEIEPVAEKHIETFYKISELSRYRNIFVFPSSIIFFDSVLRPLIRGADINWINLTISLFVTVSICLHNKYVISKVERKTWENIKNSKFIDYSKYQELEVYCSSHKSLDNLELDTFDFNKREAIITYFHAKNKVRKKALNKKFYELPERIMIHIFKKDNLASASQNDNEEKESYRIIYSILHTAGLYAVCIYFSSKSSSASQSMQVSWNLLTQFINDNTISFFDKLELIPMISIAFIVPFMFLVMLVAVPCKKIVNILLENNPLKEIKIESGIDGKITTFMVAVVGLLLSIIMWSYFIHNQAFDLTLDPDNSSVFFKWLENRD